MKIYIPYYEKLFMAYKRSKNYMTIEYWIKEN